MVEKVINLSGLCELVGGVRSLPFLPVPSLSPASIHNANSHSITFCSMEQSSVFAEVNAERTIEKIVSSKAGVVICSVKLANALAPKQMKLNKVFIFVDNPRLAFIKVIARYFFDPYEKCPVHVGGRVNIAPSAVIGGPGFGFEQDENGKWIRFPSIGDVIIEDDVDIGAGTCIDRGTLDSTIIGSGTKIDNLCHIAHNVKIGKNCMIIARSMVGGGAEIGDNCWIASATIRDNVKIGKNSMIGLGAVVVEDIPEGSVAVGVPARVIRRLKKSP